MNVVLAEHAGFCFGVKRAIQLALEASEQQHPIYTSGPLIHSPQMVAELEQHGVLVCEHPERLHDSVIIIRSHGMPAVEKAALQANGNILIDATCPFVTKAQEHIQLLCAEGYPIVIMGDATHPEVIAMQSYCSQETFVVKDASALPDRHWHKLGVLSQTTKDSKSFALLVRVLLQRTQELRIFNTICTATSLRQEASLALAKQSDLMIVIGGRNSSNTKMLAALCSEVTDTLQVETAQEIDPAFVAGKQRIGITAGASTPDYLIVEVYNVINKITGDRTSVNNVVDIPINKEESC